MLKDPIHIVYDHLDAKIGDPIDLQKFMKSGKNFDFSMLMHIPSNSCP